MPSSSFQDNLDAKCRSHNTLEPLISGRKGYQHCETWSLTHLTKFSTELYGTLN